MPANRIRMRHLRCFLAVARHGSASRAAEVMGTVQPSVSRSIRELEEELGSPVFDRTASGLVLNAAGTRLFSYVSNGMGMVDRGFDALRGELGEERVSAYVLPNVIRVLMPGAVRRFKAEYPRTVLSFLATTGGGLHENLRAGRVDFGFGRLLAPEHMDGLSFEQLFSEPLVFFVRAGHPLAGERNLTVHDLDRFEVVMPIPDTIIRAELDRFVISKGLSGFSNVTETISFEFARSYVEMSDAIVFQPLGAMHRELAEGEVVRLDFAVGELVGAVGLTTPAGRSVSAATARLMEMIRLEVEEKKQPGGYIAELL